MVNRECSKFIYRMRLGELKMRQVRQYVEVTFGGVTLTKAQKLAIDMALSNFHIDIKHGLLESERIASEYVTDILSVQKLLIKG